MSGDGEAAQDVEVTSSLHLDNCLQRLSSCFKECGEEKGHAVSVDTVCTFPDDSEDSLRLGCSCGGFCLSRCVFPMCNLRKDHFPTGANRRSKRVVASSRWRRSKFASHYPFLGRVLRSLRISGLCSAPPLPEAATNRQVIASLQNNWGSFFGDYNKFLTLGKKINGGAEGDILEATWRCGDGCHYDVVVKVFHREYLRVLSLAMLQRMAEFGFDSFAFHNAALIYKATLLTDGRFALVLRRYSRNLDELIQLRMESRSQDQGPPFLDHEAKHLMREIANGMSILHRSNILHRDLKPSNVLTLESTPIRCYGADIECDGAIGTGFYRSPEVLRALNGREDANSEIVKSYQKHSDVYSYGMTCYKICTGLAPFAHIGRSMYGGVLEGRRPEFPEFVDPRVRELIGKCWHAQPSKRPSFEICTAKRAETTGSSLSTGLCLRLRMRNR